jgi:hypothetical protein
VDGKDGGKIASRVSPGRKDFLLPNLDSIVTSRANAWLVQNHEEHEVHEAEIIVYSFNLS